MSVDSKNNGSSYEARLSKLERHLESNEDDEAMLAEIGMAMRVLLTGNGESESHIRQILERQFNQGNLRKESYELVEGLLGKLVTEEKASKPAEDAPEVPYVETTVIEQPGQSDRQAVEAPIVNQLQVGSVLRDRFLLKEQVSEGSMGAVYKALDRRLAEAGDANPFVAIKVLNARLARNGAALRALQQEAAKGRCLSHPNIVRFIDLDREEDQFFIVMEWLEGRSLSKILDENRDSSLDMSAAMDIVRQVSRALDYAHQRGVVHADIKPGNIMVKPDGQVKLIDFGVARVRQKENEGKSRFDPNVMRGGSPAYSSMQVLTGEDPVPADDVFSLACLLYRLVAGYRVFGPRNAADAAEEGMEPQPPQELNAEQWQAVKKALAYSRVTRFGSPKAFMDALGAAKIAQPARQAAAPTPPVTVPPIQSVKPQEALSIGDEAPTAPLMPDETTQIALDVPLHAPRDSIMYERDDEEPARRSPLRMVVVGIIIIGSALVVLKPDMVETITGIEPSFDAVTDMVDQITSEIADAQTEDAPTGIQDLEALPEIDVAETADDGVTEELIIDAADGSVDEVLEMEERAIDVADLPVDEVTSAGEVAVAETAAAEEKIEEVAVANEAPTVEVAAAAEPDPLPVATDFSVLPPPTLLLQFDSSEGAAVPAGTVRVREDGANAIVDLVRDGDLSQELTVRFFESVSSGARPVSESQQYFIENDGLLVFGAGQPRARIELGAHSDMDREPDRVVALSVRSVDDEPATVASINLTLEDDDQRSFEAGLAVNTVGFSVNQISVREFDPAVQVDVIRYNADNTVLEVTYTLTDVTATQGQDYFAPGINEVYFGPGQRTARILVPLGQDSRVEQGEVFTLKLDTSPAPPDSNIYSQIAVMIRDDDS